MVSQMARSARPATAAFRLSALMCVAAATVAPATLMARVCTFTVDPVLGDDAAASAAAYVAGSPSSRPTLVPWRSLGGARDAARSFPRPLPPGGLRVCLRPGRYSPSEAHAGAVLHLEGPEDSGDGPDRRIIWTGAEDSAPEFSGGVHIDFAPPAAAAPPRVPSASFVPPPGAWSADLSAFGVSDVGVWRPHGFLQPGGCAEAPLELFADGASSPSLSPSSPAATLAPYGFPLTVARWPNVAPAGAAPAGVYPEWAAEESWSRAQYVRGAPDTLNSTLFASEDAPFGNWSAATLSGANSAMWTGFPFFDWADGSAPLASFNSTSRVLALQPGELRYNVSFSAKYYVQNAPEALDAPGEYYVDPATSIVYLIPLEGMVVRSSSSSSSSPSSPSSPSSYTLPDHDGAQGTLGAWVSNTTANSTLLAASSVSHVAFVGIALSFTRGGGVLISASSDVVLANLTVTSVGTNGVLVSNSNNVSVLGVNVSHSGGAGIDVYGGGDRATLTPSLNSVVDCTVVHVGRRCLSYAGGITMDTVGGVVAHNDVSGTPHIGSSCSGNDALYEYNRLADTTLAACDMAAAYQNGNDWSEWGTIVRFNQFVRSGFSSTGCNMQSGSDLGDVYFDSSRSGASMYSNVHWTPLPPHTFSYLSKPRNTYAHIINGGSSMMASNSLVIDANVSYFQSVSSLAYSYNPYCAANGTYLAGMRAMGWDTGLYAARYPDLASLQNGCDSGPAACAADPTCPAAPYRGGYAVSANVNVTGALYVMGHNASVFDPAKLNFTGQWDGADPGFVAGSVAAAKETLNFALVADSPVYSALPTFVPIPFECIGAWACPDRPSPYPRAATVAL